jgi:DNA-directed RNA polymerase sigma subunit (sigma70/sigma32)
MAAFLWRDDDGWPYPDPDRRAPVEVPDGALEIDDDLISLRLALANRHGSLLAALEPLERQVLSRHLGLDGSPPCSLKELHRQLHLPRATVRSAYESSLAKLRARLSPRD